MHGLPLPHDTPRVAKPKLDSETTTKNVTEGIPEIKILIFIHFVSSVDSVMKQDDCATQRSPPTVLERTSRCIQHYIYLATCPTIIVMNRGLAGTITTRHK